MKLKIFFNILAIVALIVFLILLLLEVGVLLSLAVGTVATTYWKYFWFTNCLKNKGD